MQACETMDRAAGLESSHRWPVVLRPETNAEEGEDFEVLVGGNEDPWEALPATEKLVDVLQYLRLQHFYCLFCGCKVRSRISRTRIWSVLFSFWFLVLIK